MSHSESLTDNDLENLDNHNLEISLSESLTDDDLENLDRS